MAAFTGTRHHDIITFDIVSHGVVADPAGAKPSEAPDTILGLGGDDTIHSGFGSGDSISGGDGADTISGDGTLAGGAGNDVIRTLGQADTTARGGAGNDTIDGYADAGTLKLYGDGGDDRIGASSDDGDPATFLYGGTGNDTLQATSNFNNAPFGVGTNRLEGGAGDDTYVVFQSSDNVVETPGAGLDTAQSWADFILPDNVENLTLLSTGYFSYGNDAGTGNGLSNVIRGNTESNSIDGLGGNDTLYGRDTGLPPADWYGDPYADADTVHGGDGNDILYGGDGLATWDGDDSLYGEAGADALFGQAGADALFGQAGTDMLSGGAGSDIYRYAGIGESPGTGGDVILDFAGVGGEAGDRIDLSAVDANATKGGRQTFAFVSTALTGPGQLHVGDASSGDGSIVEGEVDGEPGVDFAIAVNDGAAAAAEWIAGDFIL